ncbi:MAG: 2-C-methyl-D-erythritol 2,4-cyclodiphosphate synthase [Planctomycetes bacterium]|nr:2-C-methyl-D-erythritol 2,4-cyclodiphosphate synthase [Planctomycetota bacterium]
MLTQETTKHPTLGRTRDPEGTRALLVENAFREIHAHGYAGASLDRILANSGVTKGALYHHFKSKADLLHAVIDALFGAACLPDMSERFPEDLQQLSHSLGLPVDQLHEHGITATSSQEGAEQSIGNLSSADLLAQALEEIRAGHWAINNVDVTILAKRPNLSKHKLSIKKSLADLLALEWGRVSIKSSAHSGTGAVEQGRAIACEAAVMLRATETHA